MLGQISEVKQQVGLLNRDVSNLRLLYDRLEENIHGISTSAAKLDRIISLQEQSLMTVQSMIRERDQKFTKEVEDLRQHIEKRFEKEETNRVKNLAEMGGRLSTIDSAVNKSSDKINALERFRWIVYGALVLIGFAAPYIEKIISASRP